MNQTQINRAKIIIRGIVQGIGFRPFIYRLANEYNLKGYVLNSSQGVFIEVEGNKTQIEKFILDINIKKPKKSYIQSLEYLYLEPIGYKDFKIIKSDKKDSPTTLILADIATCNDCIKELFNPNDRRYLYPFINCTNCGPRFSIINTLPYDRANTTMNEFKMCSLCQQEYDDPTNRRFHAQPNACPNCGPRIYLWDKKGLLLNEATDAIIEATSLIKQGYILAIKGIGGFHLVVDATNDKAVANLRSRKKRSQKPFAMMYPSLEHIKQDCLVNPAEERLLISCESPIVFLQKRPQIQTPISQYVVENNNPYFGIMLPYSPLHHILLHYLQTPIVATSGNLSDEPICYDEMDALKRLNYIADYFLVHNRKIVNPSDDSIIRIIKGKEFMIRRARGYAPLPIPYNNSFNRYFALGSHQKNTIAFTIDNNLFIGQHNGDLDSQNAIKQYENNIHFFVNTYKFKNPQFICDLHPDYTSTKFANELSTNPIYIQHHIAHVYSCMLENELSNDILGVSFDGTGYGLDLTVWGGEFFIIKEHNPIRFATFKPFPLVGSSSAIKTPKKCALGLCFEIFNHNFEQLKNIFVPKIFNLNEFNILYKALKANINAPLTSSVGRIFDAVSSLLELVFVNNYEAQAAMYLEFEAQKAHTNEYYKFDIIKNNNANPSYYIDLSLTIKNIITDKNTLISNSVISKKFHNTISQIILKIAMLSNMKKVALTGGCFQNKYLLENTIEVLNAFNFKVYWHQRIPTNDGGIAAGQIFATHLLNKNIIRK